MSSLSSSLNNFDNTYNGSYIAGDTYNSVGRDQYNTYNTTTVHNTGTKSYNTTKRDVKIGNITGAISPSTRFTVSKTVFLCQLDLEVMQVVVVQAVRCG